MLYNPSALYYCVSRQWNKQHLWRQHGTWHKTFPGSGRKRARPALIERAMPPAKIPGSHQQIVNTSVRISQCVLVFFEFLRTTTFSFSVGEVTSVSSSLLITPLKKCHNLNFWLGLGFGPEDWFMSPSRRSMPYFLERFICKWNERWPDFLQFGECTESFKEINYSRFSGAFCRKMIEGFNEQCIPRPLRWMWRRFCWKLTGCSNNSMTQYKDRLSYAWIFSAVSFSETLPANKF